MSKKKQKKIYSRIASVVIAQRNNEDLNLERKQFSVRSVYEKEGDLVTQRELFLSKQSRRKSDGEFKRSLP